MDLKVNVLQSSQQPQHNVDGSTANLELLTSALKNADLNISQPPLPVMGTEPARVFLGKKDNSDTKSVTSRTTFPLDEKESLRPDDSASMQAATEEDMFSPPGSVVADSRKGSEPDTRAFRDQLQVIDKTENSRILAHRAVLERPREAIRQVDGVAVNSEVVSPPVFGMASSPTPNQEQGPPVGLVVPPDEKLLDALASPKDRLFVLKIEQDMIDFLTDSK